MRNRYYFYSRVGQSCVDLYKDFNMESIKVELSNIILKGLVNDIFRAERAYFIYKTIGENVELINSNIKLKSFNQFFGSVQNSCQFDCLMSVSKIYDKPNKKYPTLCFEELLKYIEENKNQLPIIEKYQLKDQMIRVGMPTEWTDYVDSNDDQKVTQLIIVFFKNELIQNLDNIELLRKVRDKKLAHNENIEKLKGPTWNVLLQLIDLAKNFVSIIGWAHVGTAYKIHDNYNLTDDAARPSYALRKLIKDLME